MFKILTDHVLASMAESEARNDLADLGTPELEDSPVSGRMPYAPAFREYEDHVRGCTCCSDTPIWDVGCDGGTELSRRAADAMTNQERLAELN